MFTPSEHGQQKYCSCLNVFTKVVLNVKLQKKLPNSIVQNRGGTEWKPCASAVDGCGIQKKYLEIGAVLQRLPNAGVIRIAKHLIKNNKRYRNTNKEKINEYYRNKRQEKPEQYAKYGKKYRKSNPHKAIEHTERRNKYIKEAKPAWADDQAIKAIYLERDHLIEKTGIVHQVDHIIPLMSDLVCGLHCEDNLQILTDFENNQKSNKLTQKFK